ncbi:kinase-like protein [Patellaria atrata CBS 101060]|uniref:Kinase-like protein n=1 Tax=Patellaria atrata CBS 101060 TaxID=1346257 RepID=A0A9P4S3G7_9PEZI|nr:kinase-like protein [Patellaria atrata CBS 101060]
MTPSSFIKEYKPSDFRVNYVQIKELGKGGQGTAYLFRNRSNGKEIVGKVITERRFQCLAHEFKIFKAMSPSNRIIDILGTIEHYPNHNETLLLLEYCDGGDLHKWKKMSSKNVLESEIRLIFEQLAEAIFFLHHKCPETIIHNDIKPLNILLKTNKSTGNMDVKLADFGISHKFKKYRPAIEEEKAGGTPGWFAPEFPRQSPASDVFGVGAIIYYLCTGQQAGIDHPGQKPPYLLDICDFRSKRLRNAMETCLEPRYTERISSTNLHRTLNCNGPLPKSSRSGNPPPSSMPAPPAPGFSNFNQPRGRDFSDLDDRIRRLRQGDPGTFF